MKQWITNTPGRKYMTLFNRTIGVATLILSAWWALRFSWLRWPDVLIDFGRELYVPWRIAEGDILFKDIWYFNGPWSPYFNAFWFKLAGIGMQTIVHVNLLLFIVTTFLLYKVIHRMASSLTAWMGCMVFVWVFAFNQYAVIGNYNYISPYSHEMIHGILFALAAILFCMCFLGSSKLFYISGAGFCAGLAFLTKPEIFFALMAGILFQLSLFFWHRPSPLKKYLYTISIFLASVLAPILMAVLLLSIKLPVMDAVVGVLGGWYHLWNPRIADLLFYRQAMGLQQPLPNLLSMGKLMLYLTVMLVPPLLITILKVPRRVQVLLSVLFSAGLLGAAYTFRHQLNLFGIGKLLPLMMLTALVYLFWRIVRRSDSRCIDSMAFGVFAFVLLGKIILNAKLWHYGFALAMPASMVFVVMLFEWIPMEIRDKKRSPLPFQIVAIALILGIAAWHVTISNRIYQLKSTTVGQGADKIVADNRGILVQNILNWFEQNGQMGETLAVMPEGIMINYLARMKNSTPITNLMPPELLMFGEERIVQMLDRAPPTYVVLVHKNTAEYGYPYFGKDYGRSIMKWLRQNYRAVHLEGAPPLRDDRFGILISKYVDQ